MNYCDESLARMALYLDGELHAEERENFEQHLSACGACRETLAREQDFISLVRAARPLHSAPDALRARVSALLDEVTESGFSSASRRALLIAACALLAAIGALGFWLSYDRETPRSQPSEFARMAVDSHLRRLRGQLPLEISSDSPEEISDWFRDKVSFSLTLPNYQNSSGQELLYHLEGARLVAFRNDYAACVAYRMRQRPITLIVTSNAVALPAGGEEIISKGLTFHYDAIDGLKVITWADRGLTYALVSDLEERGQQSCMVCHVGTKDRDFIEGLKPAPKI